ncbi:MAG: hypothetical protein U0Y10_25205 [Spirosomataceae bacterium]
MNRKVIVARLILVGLVTVFTLLTLWIYKANRVVGKDGKDSVKTHHKHTFKRYHRWHFRRRRHR